MCLHAHVNFGFPFRTRAPLKHFSCHLAYLFKMMIFLSVRDVDWVAFAKNMTRQHGVSLPCPEASSGNRTEAWIFLQLTSKLSFELSKDARTLSCPPADPTNNCLAPHVSNFLRSRKHRSELRPLCRCSFKQGPWRTFDVLSWMNQTSYFREWGTCHVMVFISEQGDVCIANDWYPTSMIFFCNDKFK